MTRIVSKFKLSMVLYVFLALLIQNESHALKKALVIGIGDYPHVPKLNGPKTDALNIAALLQGSLGFEKNNIKLLIDRDATRENILASIDKWLVKGTSSDDEIVFYYSGHGFQTQDLNGDEADNHDEAIAAYDATIEAGQQVNNMISDDEISTIFDKLNDRSVTMIIDSCHSGTLTRGMTEPDSQQYEKTITSLVGSAPTLPKEIIDLHRQETGFIESAPRRVVWTAVSAWQKALIDIESGQGSVFTNLFIRAVKDMEADVNADQVVTRAEALSFVRSESQAFCKRNLRHCRTGLTPTLETPENLYIADVSQLNNQPPDLNQISNADYIVENLTPANNQQIRITLLPERDQYRIGEEMIMQVTSPVDGHLILLDVSSTGDIVQLFPNKYTLKQNIDHRVKALKTLHIPSNDYEFSEDEIKFNAFAASPPTGSGKIIAIVTEDDVFPEFISSIEGTFKEVDSPHTYIQQITQRLNDVWRFDDINRSVSWSMSSFDYSITD